MEERKEKGEAEVRRKEEKREKERGGGKAPPTAGLGDHIRRPKPRFPEPRVPKTTPPPREENHRQRLNPDRPPVCR